MSDGLEVHEDDMRQLIHIVRSAPFDQSVSKILVDIETYLNNQGYNILSG